MPMELTAFLRDHNQVVEGLKAEAEAAKSAAEAHAQLNGSRSSSASGMGGGGGFLNSLANLGGIGGFFGGGGGSGGGGGIGGGFFGAGGGGGFSNKIIQTANVVAAGATLAQVVVDLVKQLYSLSEAAQSVTRALIAEADSSHAGFGDATRVTMMGGDSRDAIALRNRLTSDPYAMGAAGRLGVTAVPGPYGTMDAGQTLLKTLDALRSIHDRQEQSRLIYQMGLERFTPMMRVSDETYRNFRTESAETGRKVGFNATTSAEADAASARLSNAFNNLLQTSYPLTAAFTDMKNAGADFVNWVAGLGKSKFQDSEEQRMAYGMAQSGATDEQIAKAMEQRRANAGASSALDRNSQTINDNTVAVARLTQRMEMLGGGDRARAAVPGNMMRGDQLWAAVENNTFPTHSL